MNNQIQAITTESAHVRIWQTTNYIAAALIALVYEYSYSVILYEASYMLLISLTRLILYHSGVEYQ